MIRTISSIRPILCTGHFATLSISLCISILHFVVDAMVVREGGGEQQVNDHLNLLKTIINERIVVFIWLWNYIFYEWELCTQHNVLLLLLLFVSLVISHLWLCRIMHHFTWSMQRNKDNEVKRRKFQSLSFLFRKSLTSYKRAQQTHTTNTYNKHMNQYETCRYVPRLFKLYLVQFRQYTLHSPFLLCQQVT